MLMMNERVICLQQYLCDDVLMYISEFLKPTFRDNAEFRAGIKLWFGDQSACIKRYGHISNWNTENITDMSKVFCVKESSMKILVVGTQER
jgi:hypothetical protein